MAEQTEVEDMVPAVGAPQVPSPAPSPALGRWGRVLTEALGAPEPARWGPPGTVELPEALVVYLEDPEGTPAALHLDRRCAAALVTLLLRQSAALEQRSRPEQVRRAVADHLAATATRVLGTPMRAHLALRAPRSFTELTPLWFDTREDAALGAGVRVSREADSVPRLSELALELPLVVAVGHGARGELDTLTPGDLWLPESGWLITPSALAASTTAESHGALLGLPGEGQAAVVGVRGMHVLWSGQWAPLHETNASRAHAPDVVSVRLTAGSVRLPLRRWQTLGPGELLERRDPELWAIAVDGVTRAWGVACPSEDGWGLKITLVVAGPRADSP